MSASVKHRRVTLHARINMGK